MSSNNKVNSHIQLPESILKGFSTPQNKVFGNKVEKHNIIYRMKFNCIIRPVDIKHANTQKGYYHKEIEKYLSTYETHMGDAKARLKNALKNINEGNTIQLFFDDIEAVKMYCFMCLARSPYFVNAVLPPLLMKFGLSDKQYDPNEAIRITFESKNNILEIFNGYKLTFLENTSSVGLLLPQLGFVKIPNSKNGDYCIPVSPKLAFYLSDDLKEKNNIRERYYADEKSVDKINKLAIKEEWSANVGTVYAKSKSDLARYKAYAKRLII